MKLKTKVIFSFVVLLLIGIVLNLLTGSSTTRNVPVDAGLWSDPTNPCDIDPPPPDGCYRTQIGISGECIDGHWYPCESQLDGCEVEGPGGHCAVGGGSDDNDSEIDFAIDVQTVA